MMTELTNAAVFDSVSTLILYATLNERPNVSLISVCCGIILQIMVFFMQSYIQDSSETD